jgi:hypothetical protein
LNWFDCLTIEYQYVPDPGPDRLAETWTVTDELTGTVSDRREMSERPAVVGSFVSGVTAFAYVLTATVPVVEPDIEAPVTAMPLGAYRSAEPKLCGVGDVFFTVTSKVAVCDPAQIDVSPLKVYAGGREPPVATGISAPATRQAKTNATPHDALPRRAKPAGPQILRVTSSQTCRSITKPPIS